MFSKGFFKVVESRDCVVLQGRWKSWLCGKGLKDFKILIAQKTLWKKVKLFIFPECPKRQIFDSSKLKDFEDDN